MSRPTSPSGPISSSEADRLGVVYSVGAGDEPSSCMELIEFATALGYTIVSAGKGKNNPSTTTRCRTTTARKRNAGT
jgi:predicted homoserine dehydrogenase-like protein